MAVVGICNAILIGSAGGGRAADFSDCYLKCDVGAAFQSDTGQKEFFSANPSPFGNQVATNIVNYHFRPGVRLDVAAGISLTKSFAAELEAGVIYSAAELTRQFHAAMPGGRIILVTSSQEVDYFQIPVLLNLTYKVPVQSRFKPFIGLGAGGVFSTVQDVNVNDIQFGVQGLAGFRCIINDRAQLGFVCKVLNSVGESNDLKPDGHLTASIGLTFTYRF